MKTVLMLLSMCSALLAQVKISDVTISSGRGALSSGLFVGINVALDSPKVNPFNGLMVSRHLAFQVSQDFVQAIWTLKADEYASVGWSGGYFMNAPFTGPYFEFHPSGQITFVSWSGVSAGLANAPDFNLNFSFAYHQLRFDIGPAYVSHTAISFQTDRLNQLTGAGFSMKLADNLSFSTGCDYSHRDREPLFQGVLAYQF